MKASILAQVGLAVSVWLGLTDLVAAQTWMLSDRFQRTWRISTTAGKEVKITSHSSFDNQCRWHGVYPDVITISGPFHGRIALRKIVNTVGARSIGGYKHHCFAKKIPGIGIYYRPNPGFRGEDRVSYKVLFPRRVFQDTAIIQVR